MVHIKKIFLKWIFTDKWEFIAPHGKKLENLVTQASQAGISTLNSPLASVCAQSCPTLCDPTDCSPPGSCDHGIFPGKNTGVGCHFLLQYIYLYVYKEINTLKNKIRSDFACGITVNTSHF